MAKHTPGPWHFVPENAGLMMDHGYGILYGEPDSWGWEKNLYVSVGCSGNVLRELGEGVAEANARLIAAAPDLLAALQAMVALDECEAHFEEAYERILPQARAALSRALTQQTQPTKENEG